MVGYFPPSVALLMALSNVSLADLHGRCVYATFGVRASVIHEVHGRESLWKEEFGSFHNYILAHGQAVYGCDPLLPAPPSLLQTFVKNH